MPFRSLRQRFEQSAFLRNVATMMTGTVIAQAIPMALSPVMTRLYQPGDYGIYAAFMFAAATISAFASWRYEFAIVLPKDDGEASNVVVLCFSLAVGLALLVVAAVALGGAPLLERVSGSRLGHWVYALPAMVLLMSAFQSLSYWLIRLQAFRVLTGARVARAVAMGVANIAFGVLHVPGGLILSSLAGQTVITAVLAIYAAFLSERRLRGVRVRAMRDVASRYRSFALYALPSDLLSTVASQSPILILDEVSAGLYAFVQLVLGAPLGVVSGSVLDAFKDRAARDYRERGTFAHIFDRIARSLAVLGVAPLLVILVGAPSVFPFIFGTEWAEAGVFAQILAGMYFLKLIVSPLSYSYFIVEKQREDFLLHVLVVAATAGGLWLGARELGDARLAVGLYALAYSAAYVIYFVRSRAFSRGRGRAHEPAA